MSCIGNTMSEARCPEATTPYTQCLSPRRLSVAHRPSKAPTHRVASRKSRQATRTLLVPLYTRTHHCFNTPVHFRSHFQYYSHFSLWVAQTQLKLSQIELSRANLGQPVSWNIANGGCLTWDPRLPRHTHVVRSTETCPCVSIGAQQYSISPCDDIPLRPVCVRISRSSTASSGRPEIRVSCRVARRSAVVLLTRITNQSVTR